LKEADCDLDEFFLSIDYNDEYAKSSKSVANKLGRFANNYHRFMKKNSFRELTELSKRLTPQYGERLLYVVAIPGTKYDDSESEDTFLANSISVDKFLRDPTIHLDFNYYVEHQLFPALQRILNHTSTKLTWNTLTPEDQCTELDFKY
jgi:DNA polymerase elongation subunit (family B)